MRRSKLVSPCIRILLAVSLLCLAASCEIRLNAAEPTLDSPFNQALTTIRQAESGSAQSVELAAAWKVISSATYAELSQFFAALDQANPVAANWIGMAVDRVVENEDAKGHSLPLDIARRTAIDASHSLRTRQLALELIKRGDPKLAADLQTQFVTDPQAQFRRPAIKAAIDHLAAQVKDGLPKSQQVIQWNRLFEAVRDPGQAAAIARELARLDHPVDLAAHFGYVHRWHVIGPFDNIDGEGFGTVYPPESLNPKDLVVHLSQKESQGVQQEDKAVAWQEVTSSPRNGNVDLNSVIEKLKDVLAYGAAIVESDHRQDVEVRLRVQNAFKIWLNGQLVMEQPVGHTGNSFDQYAVKVTLKKGKNLILIKSCQVKPPQEMAFFDVWHFCVRICDSTGGACRLLRPEGT